MNHFWQNITGHFDDTIMADFLINEAPPNSLIVEIGSWRGKSTSYLGVEAINSGKNIQIDAVDLWFTPNTGYNASENYEEAFPEKNIYAPDEHSMYIQFIKNMSDLRNVRPIRLCSWEAAEIYNNYSIFAVYIDGDHRYESVKKDIEAWYNKVMIGGIVSGHDIFNNADVPKAVTECFGNEYKTLNTSWYIRK
jgi:hypothetical protein